MQNLTISQRLSIFTKVSTFVLASFFGMANPSQTAAQPCVMVCNDLIMVAVPANGSLEFFPNDIAEGDLSQSCPNGIFHTQVMIGGVWQNASGNFVFDNSHIGNSYTARLRDQISGNACWGTVKVEAEQPLQDTVHFQLCAKFWKDNRPMKGATLTFQPQNAAFPYSPIVFALDTSQSCADITVILSDYLPGTLFSYSASMPDSNHLNGVNIVDICNMTEHILGIEPFSSPYAMFAADANKSGSITTLDIVEYRKLILGAYTELPNNDSWRFISDYCTFINPLNPFQNACPTAISAAELAAMDGDTAKVIGIKVGDVNGTAQLIGEPQLSPTPFDSITLLLPLGQFAAGISIAIPVKFDKNVNLGNLQAQFHLDPNLVQFESITDGAIDLNSTNGFYSAATGRLRLMWGGYQSVLVSAGTPVFYINVKTLAPTDLSVAVKVVLDDNDVKTFATTDDCSSVFAIGSKFSGSVTTYLPELSGLRVQPPSPNPYDEQSFIEIVLESAEKAVLEVVDLTGRIVFSAEKNLPSGISLWEIPASALASGSFGIWRLQVGEQRIAGKLAKR